MKFEKNDLERIHIGFANATSRSANEEALRIKIEHLLKDFFKKYEIKVDPRYERSVYKGRIDALYGFIIIEYERPNSLRLASKRKESIEQVKNYINKLSEEQTIKKDSLLGICFDGNTIIYVRWRKKWVVSKEYELNISSLRILLENFKGLSRDPLTSESLTRNFGINSDNCNQMMTALILCLKNSEHPLTEVLFNEWKKFFSESCGYDFNNPKKRMIGFASKLGLDEKEIDICFFCLHTYFSLILTLLASEVVSIRTKSVIEGFLENLMNVERTELKKLFETLPEGGVFEFSDVKNFLEGDFFWWFIGEWTLALEEAIYNMLTSLNRYEPAYSSVYTSDIKDVLKELYEDLIPREIRHDLGEYYTPNWIAEYIISSIDLEFNSRLLDPACGSGTFLIAAIRFFRENFEENTNETELVSHILNQFVGFDLNPIAIITARTNFLLAISDLIPFVEGSLFLPIFITDSIASIRKHTLTGLTYILKTSVGNFDIPVVFIDSDHRLFFFQVLEECIKDKFEFKIFKERLKEHFKEEDISTLQKTYDLFIKLEKEGKNRIWARLLANTFTPFTIKKFDFVIGNPPWIAWEYLPRSYRENTQDLWKRYNLFSIRKGSEAMYGGSKKDFSMLFVHRCVDLYLKNNGILIFLITQTVFQSVKTGEGFRKFKYGPSKYIEVTKVDDMIKIKPFRAANQTSIMYCRKGNKTKYPIDYLKWNKIPDTKIDFTSNSLSYSDAKKNVSIKKALAQPSTSREGAPWIIYPLRSRDFPKIIKNLTGTTPSLKGKAGVTTWLNGVFYVRIIERYPDGKILIENLYDTGKIKVPKTRAKIEPDLLYPLLRGKDVNLWGTENPEDQYILITNNPATRRAISLNRMAVNYPLTLNYLKKFEVHLKKRSGYKKYFKSKGPFYAIYNVSRELFSPFRLIWSEMGKFSCAIIKTINDPFLGKKLPIPNNKSMFIPFSNENEALFIGSILNSTKIRKYIDARKLTTSTSTKLFTQMKLPMYDLKNEKHNLIAKLASQISNTQKIKKKDITELEKLIYELIIK